MNNYCRLCLQESSFQNHTDVKELLNYCVPEVKTELTLEPVEVCFNCYTQLKTFQTFKSSILKTQEELYQYKKMENAHKISLNEFLSKKTLLVKEECIESGASDSEECLIKVESPKLQDECNNSDYEISMTVKTLDDDETSIDTKFAPSELVNLIEEIKPSSDSNANSKYGKREYTCERCEYKAVRGDLLQKHAAKCGLDAAPKQFRCRFCAYASKRKRNVTRHEFKHDGHKPYQCDICKKRFVEKCNLRDHIYRHLGRGPFTYKCCECAKEFVRKCDLNSHLALRHPALRPRPFACPHCRRTFADDNSCRSHAKRHHEPTQLLPETYLH